MSDEKQDRLSEDEAKRLIKTIEEVEKEEADKIEAESKSGDED